MDRRAELLLEIAKEFNIKQGAREDAIKWVARALYTLFGKMGIASLWDTLDEQSPVSIKHFRNRVEKTYEAYLNIYPELKSQFLCSPEELSNEILGIYRNAGFIYHSSYRLAPSKYTEAYGNGISLIRGAYLDKNYSYSGLAEYTVGKHENCKSITEAYGIPQVLLNDHWKTVVSIAKWYQCDYEIDAEYLRTAAPFTKGYWKNNPDLNGKVAMLRIRNQGDAAYYLYKYRDRALELASIPGWMTSGYSYRRLALGLLYSNGQNPPIGFREDGELVHIKQHYLLPAEELNLIRAYSWPESFVNFPSDFNRCMAKPVFEALKSMLQSLGYQFVKEA